MAQKWDLTSTHSLEAAAEYLRKKADALIVVVIRPGDGALAVDELLDALDVHDRLWDGAVVGTMQPLLRRLKEMRDEKRQKVLKREAKK